MGVAARSVVSGFRRSRKSCSGQPRCRQRGLTIVELILVIVIIGVLGALAGPRFFDDRTFDERAYAEEVASVLRYAQKVAIGSGCRVRVDLAAAGYTLTQQSASGGHCNPSDTSFTTPVGLPTGEPASGSAPAGVSVVPPLVIVFDALGRTSLGGDQAVSIGPHALTIRANSGLVTGP